jgi:hypothetical protein
MIAASRSLTIAARGPSGRSRVSKARPRVTGMPMVSKYRGPTVLNPLKTGSARSTLPRNT